MIISHAVWLYHRFGLSFRDVEDLLAERGLTVTYEAIRHWNLRFGLDYARRWRHCRGRQGDTWHLDELFVKIQGRQQYLWRAVDEDGDLIDILVQSRRDRHAARRFFRKLLKRQGREPRSSGAASDTAARPRYTRDEPGFCRDGERWHADTGRTLTPVSRRERGRPGAAQRRPGLARRRRD